MSTLIFEQIGSGNTRFRLKKDDYTFELNYHRPYSFWMLSCYSSRLRSNLSLPRKDFHNIKDSLEVVKDFFDYKYDIKFGANEYPNHSEQLKAFCLDKQLEFDFSEAVDIALKEDECQCGNKENKYGGHMNFCPKSTK